MAPVRKVLLYGHDQMLITLRRKVLESSGFATQITDNSEDTLALIGNEPFDLLILCHTLSDNECLMILKALKSHPAMKRLVLSHGYRSLPPTMFDGECNLTAGPECLIEQTSLLLNVAPRFPAGTRRPQG